MTGSTEAKADLPTVIKILEGMSRKFDEVDSRLSAIEGRTGNVSLQAPVPGVQGGAAQAPANPAGPQGSSLTQLAASNPQVLGIILEKLGIGKPKVEPEDQFMKQAERFGQMLQILEMYRGRNVVEEEIVKASIQQAIRRPGFMERDAQERVRHELARRETARVPQGKKL